MQQQNFLYGFTINEYVFLNHAFLSLQVWIIFCLIFWIKLNKYLADTLPKVKLIIVVIFQIEFTNFDT